MNNKLLQVGTTTNFLYGTFTRRLQLLNLKTIWLLLKRLHGLRISMGCLLVVEVIFCLHILNLIRNRRSLY